MRKKIVGIFVCMLMILTIIDTTSAVVISNGGSGIIEPNDIPFIENNNPICFDDYPDQEQLDYDSWWWFWGRRAFWPEIG